MRPCLQGVPRRAPLAARPIRDLRLLPQVGVYLVAFGLHAIAHHGIVGLGTSARGQVRLKVEFVKFRFEYV